MVGHLIQKMKEWGNQAKAMLISYIDDKPRLKALGNRIHLHLITQKKRYYIYSGALFYFFFMSWLFTYLMSPYEALTTRLFLFVLALIPLAFLVRWDDNRVVIIFSFLTFNLLTLAHTLWFPKFYAIITPVFPIFLEYQYFLPDIAKFNETGQFLLNIARFGYFIDLLIVLTLAGMISYSSQQFNMIMKNRKRRLLRITGVIFVLITLILMPYMVISGTGVMHFGLAYGSGAMQLQAGVDSMIENQNFQEARPFFVRAAQEYGLAEKLFDTMFELQLNDLLLALEPNLESLISQGSTLIEASFRLADLFVPFVDGMVFIEKGTDVIVDRNLQFDGNKLDEMKFLFEQSRNKLLTAQLPLLLSVILLESLDIDAFNEAIKERGIGDYRKELQLIKYSGLLFNATMDIILLQLLPLDNYSFPLYHTMEAILHAQTAQEQIGNQTRYASIIPTFEYLIGNLTVVSSGLNTSRFNQYSVLDDLSVGRNSDLIEAKNLINGLFNFLRDLVSIGIELGSFGISTAQILQNINNSLVPLTSEITKIPNIENEVLDEANSILGTVRTRASDLELKAQDIENSILNMRDNASEGKYGIFNRQAKLVVNTLLEFQLAQNAKNFYHLASASYFLVFAIKEFQYFDIYVSDIRSNVTIIKDNSSNATAVSLAKERINASLIEAEKSVLYIDQNLTLVEFHLNQVENMPEVELFQTVVEAMRSSLDRISQPIEGNLDVISTEVDQIVLPIISELLDRIEEELGEIEGYFTDVDLALDGISLQTSN